MSISCAGQADALHIGGWRERLFAVSIYAPWRCSARPSFAPIAAFAPLNRLLQGERHFTDRVRKIVPQCFFVTSRIAAAEPAIRRRRRRP